MNQIEVDRQFRGSVSRTISVALAAFVVLVAAVGGVSLALALGLYRDLDAQACEYEHIVSLDRAHSVFDDMGFDLYSAGAAIPDEGLAEAVLESEEFFRLVGSLEKSHFDRPGEQNGGEQEGLVLLRRHGTNVSAILQRLTAADRPGMTQDESRTVLLANREVHRLAAELAELHRARINQLLDASEHRLQAIVALYVSFLVLAGMLIVVAGLSARRRVTQPLRWLAAAVRDIADGRRDARVPVHTDDEIGLLSHSFNVMAVRLQEHEAELHRTNRALESKIQETQVLYRIGTEISRLQQLDRVLQSVVDKARELLRGDAAALCLFGPGSADLEAEATSGPPEAFWTGCLASGCTPVPADPAAVGTAVNPVIRPEYSRGHLSAPFRLREGDEGVIYVSTREERQFTADEAELLAALATQAAIAIDRAKLSEMAQELATVEERGRLAREIHDGFAQSLGLLHLKLQDTLARAGDSAEVVESLRELIHITEDAYEEVRESILGLRTTVLHGSGLVAALAEHLRGFQAHNDIDVTLEVVDGSLDRLPPKSEVQAIRIIQEALTNVRRHAGVDRARVRLERINGSVRLTVEDDGAGWDPQTAQGARHFGLQTMRERAESVGGELEVETAPGRGTRIVVTLPGEAR